MGNISFQAVFILKLKTQYPLPLEGKDGDENIQNPFEFWSNALLSASLTSYSFFYRLISTSLVFSCRSPSLNYSLGGTTFLSLFLHTAVFEF